MSGLLLLAQAIAASPPAGVNTDLPEYGGVHGPDGYYFVRKSALFGEGGSERIWRLETGGETVSPMWASPVASEGDPYFSADGIKVCFVSNRNYRNPAPSAPLVDAPANAAAKPSGDLNDNSDIWCAERSDSGWSEAYRLPDPVNSSQDEYSPVLAADGSLYFASERPGGEGMGDLYRALENPAGEWVVSNLGPTVNGAGGEWNLELSADLQTLIFEASHRYSNRSVSGDLYLSRRAADGHWQPPVPLSSINTTGSDLMARFKHGNQRFEYASGAGNVDILEAEPTDVWPLEPSLLVMSRSAHEMIVLDPETLQVRRRLPVGMGSHEVASTDDGRLAVTVSLGVFPRPHQGPIQPQALKWESEQSQGISVHDLISGSRQDYLLTDCRRPHGVATRAQGPQFWITCEDSGRIVAIHARDGKLVNSIPVEKGVHKVMLLQQKGLLVASNPDAGAVHLVRLADQTIRTVTTGHGAEALAADDDETRIWVANSFDKTLCAVGISPVVANDDVSGTNASTNHVNCWPTGGSFPIALAVERPRGRLWIARSGSSDVAEWSTETNEITRVIPLGSPPLGMALDAKRQRLYLTLPRLNQVVMIDIVSGEIKARAENLMEADDLDLVPANYFDSAPDT